MSLRLHFLNDLIEALHEKGRTDYIEFVNKMIPSSQKVLGLKTADMRLVIKQFYPEIKELPFQEFFDLLIVLKATEIFEVGLVANEFVSKSKGFRKKLNAQHINDLMIGLDNWASVDSYATYVSGPAWINDQLSKEDVLKWSASKDVWVRRLAIVSCVPLVRKSEGEEWKRDITLLLCKMHLADSEMIIHKAISWALRSLVRCWAQDVLDFVDANKLLFKPFVEREVVNKIKTGRKN